MADISLVLVNEYVLPEILRYFSLNDIENCRLVSREWKDAVDTIIKNNSSIFQHLLKELHKGDWFNRNKLRITQLDSRFPSPDDSSKTLRLSFDRFLMDSKFIYGAGRKCRFDYYGSATDNNFLLKFDCQTGKMTEIEPSQSGGEIVVCGDFILHNNPWREVYPHPHCPWIGAGKWALSNKNNLKLNGRNCHEYKSIEDRLNQIKMKKVLFQNNKYGIWTIEDNGDELEVFLLSDIHQGFQSRGVLKKNMDGEKKRNWTLEDVIGMKNGFFCSMENVDINQYLFISLPEVKVLERIFSEDLKTVWDAPVNISSREQNEFVITFETDEYYFFYNQEGKECMKIRKKIDETRYWCWGDESDREEGKNILSFTSGF